MLRSLEIRNYRNLRHLTIEKLGRVNLLVGKNNTGKTSVLEAVSILIHKANLQAITQIFEERGENVPRMSTSGPEQRIENNTELLSGMFHGRECSTDKKNSIVISSLGGESVSLRFVNYAKEVIEDEYSQDAYSKIIVVDSASESEGLGIEIIDDNTFRVLTLDRDLSRPLRFGSMRENVQFVRTSGITRDSNGRLWDKITSTENNAYVEDALKIVEPAVTGLRFILPNVDSYATRKKDERIGVVQLKGLSKPISLSSMGDGINRILTIILAMVNCENGYLLIDEFENGLHYSVQEKLWKIIFYLAENLNTQVFATTHSLDCVEAFSSVLSNGKQDKDAGALIRLENYDGNIEATVYDADEIQATTRVQVDPR